MPIWGISSALEIEIAHTHTHTHTDNSVDRAAYMPRQSEGKTGAGQHNSIPMFSIGFSSVALRILNGWWKKHLQRELAIKLSIELARFSFMTENCE